MQKRLRRQSRDTPAEAHYRAEAEAVDQAAAARVEGLGTRRTRIDGEHLVAREEVGVKLSEQQRLVELRRRHHRELIEATREIQSKRLERIVSIRRELSKRLAAYIEKGCSVQLD